MNKYIVIIVVEGRKFGRAKVDNDNKNTTKKLCVILSEFVVFLLDNIVKAIMIKVIENVSA